MAYRIVVTRRAEKDLAALPKAALRRIEAKILSLASAPRPAEAIKLKGADTLYRVYLARGRLGARPTSQRTDEAHDKRVRQ